MTDIEVASALQFRTRIVAIGLWDGTHDAAVRLVDSIKQVLAPSGAELRKANVSVYRGTSGDGAEIRLTIVHADPKYGGLARDARIFPGGAIVMLFHPDGAYLWSGVMPEEAARALAEERADTVVVHEPSQPGTLRVIESP